MNHTERPPPLGMDTFGNQFSISLANLQSQLVKRSQGSCRESGKFCTGDLQIHSGHDIPRVLASQPQAK